MRKIDKSTIHSSIYKKEIDQLNKDGKPHPGPDHERYRKEVTMSLLHCQKGVCAYTEKFLCECSLLTADNWVNGRYKEKKPAHYGSIDHFDPGLKKEKCWEWDNLFVVLDRINLKKGTKRVNPLFKPDSDGYKPDNFLQYDKETHRFRPKRDLEENLKKQIQEMIDSLFLNFGTVVEDRRMYLVEKLENIDKDRPIKIEQFFTACRMSGLEVEVE